MYQIIKLEAHYREYHKAVGKLIKLMGKIETTLLQNDQNDQVEEKITSILIALGFMTVVSAVLGWLGLPGGFLVGLVFFAIGLVLSRLINRRIFGTPRQESQLQPAETAILERIRSMKATLGPTQTRLSLRREPVLFAYYALRSRGLKELYVHLENHNPTDLAWKYQHRYQGHAKELHSCHRAYQKACAQPRINPRRSVA